MAYILQTRKNVEVTSQDKEVVIKLEITLNVNMATGQVTVGAVPLSTTEQNSMKEPEFIIPKFDSATELIEGFGESQ